MAAPSGSASHVTADQSPPNALLAANGSLTDQLGGEFPFKAHYLQHAGHWLHYVDEGPRDGEVLLLVHGNPTWSFFWRAWIQQLSKTHRVIAIDLLGCGLSEKPADGDYTLAGHGRSVAALAEHLELERITLGLHDWGGAIGMNFARLAPERIARLVFANTAAFPHPSLPKRIAACRLPLIGPLLVRGLSGFTRAALKMTTRDELSKTVRHAYSAPYSNWADRVAIQAFVDDIPMSAVHPSRAELEAVEQGLALFREHPALILWGLRDWCFTPAILERWSEFLPNARVERYGDAGHWLLEDEPQRTADEVARFLGENPLPVPKSTGA